jgi:hypothetical protein
VRRGRCRAGRNHPRAVRAGAVPLRRLTGLGHAVWCEMCVEHVTLARAGGYVTSGGQDGPETRAHAASRRYGARAIQGPSQGVKRWQRSGTQCAGW